MTGQISNDPLHGRTLEFILTYLVEYYGWDVGLDRWGCRGCGCADGIDPGQSIHYGDLYVDGDKRVWVCDGAGNSDGDSGDTA